MKTAQLRTHCHRRDSIKNLVRPAHASPHHQFQTAILICAIHAEVGIQNGGERSKYNLSEVQRILKRLQRLILPGQMCGQIPVPRIDRAHEPVAFHRIAFPSHSQQHQWFPRVSARAHLAACPAKKVRGVEKFSHRRSIDAAVCLAVGSARKITNCANAVNSATIGVPICLRITNSKSTIANHCHRELFNRSNRSVSMKSRCGARPLALGASARARKHAIAKNPESRTSTSNA